MAKEKRYVDPMEELIVGCLGRILLIGMAFGAAVVLAIWGIVELCQEIF
ncbi:membrane protein [Streptomyces phage TunaTartare]|uniref:Membrane protein n=1 Tax=Streptomyces phage TunaTartare TaxID=2848887 RepID=A0A8F2IW95_9CAUD|nr:membrane protein [Streptomyces phage TunaTartare]QWT30089.1 membrane protein [Streptomyces phage TunaTartare]